MASDRARECPRPEVKIGWIMMGAWVPDRRRAVAEAAETMSARLARALPGFDWRIGAIERSREAPTGPVEPVVVLDEAEAERDRHGWDFVVVTNRRLVSYSRDAQATPARLFSTAIVSTARLNDPEDGDARLGARLLALAMHLFGRLCDLAPRRVSDLDCIGRFRAEEIESLACRRGRPRLHVPP